MNNKTVHIIFYSLFISVSSYGQSILNQEINIDAHEVKFEEILQIITQQTSIHFSYNANVFQENQRFTIQQKNLTVKEALEKLLLGTKLSYSEFKKQVIFYRPKPEENPEYTINGMVIDSLTGLGIENAHVYFDETEIGVFTDENGGFELVDIPEGIYDLVVSHVSYGINNYYINVSDDEDKIKIPLALQYNLLKELEVISSTSKAFNKYLKIFKKEILGQTLNADLCVINNIEDIFVYVDSSYSAEEFEVFTKKPISISNFSLGYEVLFDLVFYETRKEHTLYIGKTNFTPIKSDSRKMTNKWRKNRKEAYHGSLRDFVNTSFKSETKMNNFEIQSTNKIPDSLKFKYFPADIKSKEVLKLIDISEDIKNDKYLSIYHKTSKSMSYLSKAGFEKIEGYRDELLEDYFDTNLGVLIYGEWAEKRLADTLPLKYTNKLEKNKKRIREKYPAAVN